MSGAWDLALGLVEADAGCVGGFDGVGVAVLRLRLPPEMTEFCDSAL